MLLLLKCTASQNPAHMCWSVYSKHQEHSLNTYSYCPKNATAK
jgi:hypothetical protein